MLPRGRRARPAAPAGGARQRGRGCTLALALLAAPAGVGAAADTLATPASGDAPQAIPVPSGMNVSFFDVIRDAPGNGLTYRFRFLAPEIGGPAPLPYEAIAGDMAFLCETYVLARLSNLGPQPQQVVISLMDRPVEFGEITSDAVQYFEGYSPEGDRCIWEPF